LRFVLDTGVLVSALRSRRGASAALLSALPLSDWQLALSVPLYLEYQDVLLRPGKVPPSFTPADLSGLCRYLASIAHPPDIHFLWRSFLPDPKDDMLLELAMAAGARQIVTHNLRHFRGAESFGVRALAPREFLRLVGLRP
jgi:predicted nucleic acid-binding protein